VLGCFFVTDRRRIAETRLVFTDDAQRPPERVPDAPP
jgi:hypothetical protein